MYIISRLISAMKNRGSRCLWTRPDTITKKINSLHTVEPINLSLDLYGLNSITTPSKKNLKEHITVYWKPIFLYEPQRPPPTQIHTKTHAHMRKHRYTDTHTHTKEKAVHRCSEEGKRSSLDMDHVHPADRWLYKKKGFSYIMTAYLELSEEYERDNYHLLDNINQSKRSGPKQHIYSLNLV